LIANISGIRDIKRIFDYGFNILKHYYKLEIPLNHIAAICKQEEYVISLLKSFMKID
jgi:hypothetical protein